jgi:hypothetical protein
MAMCMGPAATITRTHRTAKNEEIRLKFTKGLPQRGIFYLSRDGKRNF